ncbi:MAG: TlpA disulfide reductase family protein [Pseudomonadota bacterium]
MRTLAFLGLLIGTIAVGVNPGAAADLSVEDQRVLKDLREGDMNKLVVHREARPRIEETWRDQHGNGYEVADYAGKVVFLNFWATWCPPCLKELPSIDRLAGEMEGDEFEVIALSTDRFDVERVASVFSDGSKLHDGYVVEHLEVMQDRTGAVARRAAALGLPITIILDRQGREIARLTGEAEWDSPRAKAILTRLIEMTAPST